MEKVEIIEKYREGKLYERVINGVPFPVSEFEKNALVWGTWDTLPTYIQETKTMTYEDFENKYGKQFLKP
jgi:hypothetical protein